MLIPRYPSEEELARMEAELHKRALQIAERAECSFFDIFVPLPSAEDLVKDLTK